MKKYMLLYKGPATPPDASHAEWPGWFKKIGDALVDVGSPMINGVALQGDEATRSAAINLNGYSIIQAETADEVMSLVKDHPYLAQGSDAYSIQIFELPRG
jgi:hypothetical protein